MPSRLEPEPCCTLAYSVPEEEGACARLILADAVAVLREPGRRPVSSGEDGLAAEEAIERILSLL